MSAITVNLKDLLEAGCHFGHQSRRWNPKMMSYLFTERDGVHIFDLVKTKEGLEAACEYVKDLTARGGKIIFVGTKRQAADIVKEVAIRVGTPFVTERWLGGTLTNFEQFKKRLNRLADLKAKREAGELKQYTKKEQLLFDREINKLERFLGGISSLTALPDAVFVVDTHREDIVVREAKRVGIKVVGIVDSNSDPSDVDYVIAANDDAVKSIKLLVETIGMAVTEGRNVNEPKSEGKKTSKKKVVEEIGEMEAEPEEV